jgi:hypothetical protein
MLFDFSDSEWHFGLDGVIEMVNAYPHTPLLLHHWGCSSRRSRSARSFAPGCLGIQGRPSRCLSHRLLTHHRLPYRHRPFTHP